jgi:hypothetical protein
VAQDASFCPDKCYCDGLAAVCPSMTPSPLQTTSSSTVTTNVTKTLSSTVIIASTTSPTSTLPTVAVAGGVAGCVVLMCIVVAIGYLMRRRAAMRAAAPKISLSDFVSTWEMSPDNEAGDQEKLIT